jgi:hypothetical protein
LKRGVIRLKQSECPAPVAKEILDAFYANGKPTPKEHPNLLDWKSPLTSSWNSQAIYLLADAFKKEIEAGQHPTMRLNLKDYPDDQLVKWCVAKLAPTREEYRSTLPPDPRSHETPEEKITRVEQNKSRTRSRNKRRTRKTLVLHVCTVDD